MPHAVDVYGCTHQHDVYQIYDHSVMFSKTIVNICDYEWMVGTVRARRILSFFLSYLFLFNGLCPIHLRDFRSAPCVKIISARKGK